MSSSIQVQSILFGNNVAEVKRLSQALAAAIRYAKDSGAIDETSVVFGDCSPVPVLSPKLVEDISAEFHQTASVGFRYEFFDENRMTARGHNSLAADVTTDFLLVINPDTYVRPDAIDKLMVPMASKTVAEAEARQAPLEHPKDWDESSGATSWASTCCVVIRNSAFIEVGGFDDHFFPLYCDDVDFSWRLRLAGYQVVYVPEAVVFHDKRLDASATMEASSVERYYGANARLMLSRRYARPDIERETRVSIGSQSVEPLQRALADFDARSSAGDTPAALPDAVRVAQFVDGEYAVHRF